MSDAVDAVLAGDLGEQAAQLGAALAGRRRWAGASRWASDSIVTMWGGTPRWAPAVVTAHERSASLETGAAAHLGLDVGEARQDRLDVAVADGLALAQDGSQQPAPRGELVVEMPDDVVAELRRVHEGGGHLPTLVEGRG